MLRLLPLFAALLFCACSPKKTEPAGQSGGPARAQPVVALAENVKHPLAKHIEVAGLRMSEKPGGKLTVKLVVVNHSLADVADLVLDLTTPACQVTVKAPPLGPEESKEVSAECSTKLRVYELPDWQYVRPVFKITAPAE